MPRYVVVLPLEPLAVGDSFLTRDWPLHVTIVPVFHADATVDELVEALQDAPPGAIEVTAGDDERFGPGASIPVTVIEPSPGILALHRALLAALAPLEPVIESARYSGDGYRPHVTIRKFGRVERGETLVLTQLAVVDMEPGQHLGMRKVLGVVGLL